MDSLDSPPSNAPPPPPKRLSRPKITLQIPDHGQIPRGPVTANSVYWGQPRFQTRPPGTPASHVSGPQVHPHYNPFVYMHGNKASDFMFKQFAGFKDFTMNTAKSGLSFGEKTAFWFFSKLSLLSKRWFTHIFLCLCLILYSLMGAGIFMALEGPYEEKYDETLRSVRVYFANHIQDLLNTNKSIYQNTDRFLNGIEAFLIDYETNYTECMKHLPNNDDKNVTWTFWNSMFYAGTIYTTIAIEINHKYNYLKTNGGPYGTRIGRVCGRFRLTVWRRVGDWTNEDLYVPFEARVVNKIGTNVLALVLFNDVSVGMSKQDSEHLHQPPQNIPLIKAESETQTSGHLVKISAEKKQENMETPEQTQNVMSIKKRRNLSKNRGQGTRQREKTPEPGRSGIPHEDTPTSDDEYTPPLRSSREIEADSTYEEMKRLVSEKANVKDPIYDLDVDEVRVARAVAANERRRRSISPFALPDREEGTKLERKGSFIDPTNKLLSTTYTLSPKEDETGRRNSLTIEPTRERKNSLSPSTPTSVSPKEKFEFNFPSQNASKKQDEKLYPDEATKKTQEQKPQNKLVTPAKKDKAEVFTFDKKEEKITKANVKAQTPKTSESEQGEIVTKVIQVERTPSKKLSQENKPVVEIRQRIVRTPSRKSVTEAKPNVVKQTIKQKEETQSRAPPVKPPRSKSATRFGGRTSESEMSEDQGIHQNTGAVTAPRRKIAPTPRRFLKNRSPRGLRSQSVNRVENVPDKTVIGMSQTSREIIELMQQARARSLSIPKDDPRLLHEYKDLKIHNNRNLATPNKTPSTSRQSRGVSSPKTIQIISDAEILAGLSPIRKLDLEAGKSKTRNSGYIDASQSEYTSSCYSTTPSEDECDFNLSERTAELTSKLNLLSQKVDLQSSNIIFSNDDFLKKELGRHIRPGLRKRAVADKNSLQKEEDPTKSKIYDKETLKVNDTKENKDKKQKASKWKFFVFGDRWRQHISENRIAYEKLKLQRNKCICDLLMLVIMCGLGGMMFKTLEGSFENAYKCSSRNVKRDFIENLWRGSHYMREDDWKSMARNKLHEFEDQLHTAHEAGVTSYSGQRSWNFMNSFVYCFTLITTIGYGHIAPKTTSGRVATIVYAIVGIPLFLIVLADFGKLFTRIIKFFWSFIRRFYFTRSCKRVRRTVPVQEVMRGLNIVYDVVRRPSQILFEDEEGCQKAEDGDSVEGGVETVPPLQRKPSADVPPPLPPKGVPTFMRDPEAETDLDTPAPSVFEIDDEFNLPISLAIFILVVYIIIGAVAYNLWEKWNFFESFYFVFISMSTIGLGDLVPDHPMFMMASILYLVFGLSLTSMCINVVQVKLSDTFKKASAKLGATIGLKVAEEDGSLVPITPPPTEIVPIHKPRKVDGDKDNKNKKDEVEITPDNTNR